MIADDLATLRITVRTANPIANVEAALDRVEAEIARLEQENGALRAENALKRTINRNAIEKWTAAEAEAARLRDGLRRIADWPYDTMVRSGEDGPIQKLARALLAEDGAA